MHTSTMRLSSWTNLRRDEAKQGYMDTILFLTVGEPDFYQHKSLGKSATVFYPSMLTPEIVTNNY